MRRRGLVLAAALLLGACGEAPPSRRPSDDGLRPGRAATDAVRPPARPARATESLVEAKTADYDFSYVYPAPAAAIPPLKAWLDGDRTELRRTVAEEARNGRQDAKEGGFEYHKYEATVAWSVVTDTPRFLSLSAERSGYSGGAHGYLGFDAALWDKEAGRRVKPAALFASIDAMQRAIGPAFCRAVDAARAERRGEPVVPVADDPFTQCPKLGEVTIIPGSRGGKAIDRLGFLIDPYVAGAWAEGPYDVTLPVTRTVVQALRPEYRDAFAAQ